MFLPAFRVKLFGEFITKLPDYELARHEDIPLPESSAEPFHGHQSIDAKLFIPGQNLRGTMIPSTEEYDAEDYSPSKETNDLVEIFNDLLTKRQGEQEPVENVHDNFELVNEENQIVCVRSSDVSHDHSDERMIKRLSSRTIQTALDNHETQGIQEAPKIPKQKSKWLFSASIQLSLTKEPVKEDETAHLLDHDRRNQNMIEDTTCDAIQEEGIEIVPGSLRDKSESNGDVSLIENTETDHVSVLYVKENSNPITGID